MHSTPIQVCLAKIRVSCVYPTHTSSCLSKWESSKRLSYIAVVVSLPGLGQYFEHNPLVPESWLGHSRLPMTFSLLIAVIISNVGVCSINNKDICPQF